MTARRRAATVLKASADPHRRAIVRRLIAEGDRRCGTFGLPVAASTPSHHFRALRQAGIIREWDEERQRRTTLRLDEPDMRFPDSVAKVLAADRPRALQPIG